jgi:CubicO group peptidase (beta-lactamase class C family)
MRMQVATCVLTLSLAAGAAETSWPTRGWETATPASQGMDARALQSLVEFGAYNQMDSLLVARHGRIVLDAYYAPFAAGQRHTINSATKGIVAGLVGIAVDQRVLPDPNTPVLQLLPGRTAAHVDARKQAMTLQHLLDMTSGLDWDERLGGVPVTSMQMGQAADWTQFTLDRPMAQAPGAGFNYNSGNSQLASAILAAHAGMSTEQFAARHLFEPLGIRDWFWRKGPEGVNTGGFGLYLQPRDMARIGLLYLQGGQWEGRQLIPRPWVDKVFRASIAMDLAPGTDYRYADSWWVLPGRKAYMAVGFLRQMIVVLPEQQLVVVTTGKRHYSIDQFLDHVIAAVRAPSALPADPAAEAALAQRVRAAAVETADAVQPASPRAAKVSGRTWKAEPNELGIQQFTLRLAGAQPEVALRYGGRVPAREAVLKLGADGRFARTDTPRGTSLGKLAWTNEATLALHTRMLEDAQDVTYLLRFDGDDSVAVEFSSNNGWKTRFAAHAE